MIFVKRTAAPAVFYKKKEAIKKEMLKAKTFFNGNPDQIKPKTLFKFYSSQKDAYKDELIAMFKHRCAYCECLVTIGSRGDVEHFRPKGDYVKKDGQTGLPGYYWLAADWDNLYLSCTNCNQTTTFKIINPNDATNVIEKPVGKMNHFALSNEQFRLSNESQQLEIEEPYRLLIDPCRDKPDALLEFTAEGVVLARNKEGKAQEMAQYSIDVYGLQRERLVGHRKKHYKKIMDKILSVKRFKELVINGLKQQLQTEQHSINCAQMEQDFLNLMEMLDPDLSYNEYIGPGREHAGPFLADYTKVLNDLLNNNLNAAMPWFAGAIAYFEPQVKALKSYVDKL